MVGGGGGGGGKDIWSPVYGGDFASQKRVRKRFATFEKRVPGVRSSRPLGEILYMNEVSKKHTEDFYFFGMMHDFLLVLRTL